MATPAEGSAVRGTRWIAPIQHTRSVAITGIVGLVLIVSWGLAIRGNAAVTGWDQRLLVTINSAHSPAFDALGRLVSVVFSTLGALVVIVGVVVVLTLICRRLGGALFAGFAIGVIYGSVYLVKVIVHRPRPSALPHIVQGLTVDPSLSFPSGHVTMISSVVVVLFLIARRRAFRLLVAVIGGVLMAVVAYARLYVGAHFLEDVIASMLYAVAVGPWIFAILYWIDSRLGVVAKVNALANRAAQDGPVASHG